MSTSIPIAGEVLLGVAALLILLSIAPARAGYAVSPRVGRALTHGRMTFAGAGIAVVVGLIVSFGLGGAL